MKETVSGVRVRGDWNEVVDHGEQATEALKETVEDEAEVEEWEDWRPRDHEDKDDHREKTVDKAVVDEGPAEKEGKAPSEGVENALEDAGSAVKEASHGHLREAADEMSDATREASVSVEAVARKCLRAVERFILSKIVSRVNPHYFDSELVSASLEEKRGREYVMDIAINDDRMQDEFKEKMRDN